MINDLTNRSKEAVEAWTAKQAYLALGGMIVEASARGIDNHAAEGFMPDTYDEILELKEKNLHAVVVLALGYRAADDQSQHYPKVRVASDEMIVHI